MAAGGWRSTSGADLPIPSEGTVGLMGQAGESRGPARRLPGVARAVDGLRRGLGRRLAVLVVAAVAASAGVAASSVGQTERVAAGLAGGLGVLLAAMLARVGGQRRRAARAATALGLEVERLREQLAHEVDARRRAEVEMDRARDAASRAEHRHGEFVATVSDGVRTPLNSVLGAVDLLLAGELLPQQREYARIAQASGDALLAAVSAALDFARLEDGDLDLDQGPFRLRDLMGAALSALRLAAEAKGLVLACEVSPEVPDEFVGDAGRLRQIVTTLVDHAVGETQAGGVDVQVRIEGAADRWAGLHVAVSDSGPGLPPERQATLFDVHPAAGAPARRLGGVGLGLSVCAGLVRRMGGRIWVETAPGAGTTVHFTVRLALDPEAQAGTRPPPAALRDLPVLIVDPAEGSRRVLAGMLGGWHALPTAVESAAAALFALRRAHERGAPFRLALVNAHLPDLDGVTLAARVRGEPGLEGTRVLLLTTAVDDGTVARDSHADGVVTLPVRSEALLRAAAGALGVPLPDPAVRRTESGGAGVRVLVADDNPANRQLAIWWLERRGYRAVAVENGREAVDAVERERLDLILMDVAMPVLDGLDATVAIRARERTSGGHVPIIALTALAQPGDRERCRMAGMDAYVTKPVRVAELYATIERLLAPARAASGDAVDRRALLEDLGDDPAVLLSVVESFQARSGELLARLRQTCAGGDAAGLAQTARQLGESCSTVGAAVAARAAAELEALSGAGRLDGAVDALAALEREIARIRPELEALAGLPARA